MDNDPNAIAERVANKLVGMRAHIVHIDRPVWERTTYEIEVPNDITTAEDIEEYASEKINEDPDKYEVTSHIIGAVQGLDAQYEIDPA